MIGAIASAARLIVEIAAAVSASRSSAPPLPRRSRGSIATSCRRSSSRASGTCVIETIVRVVIAGAGALIVFSRTASDARDGARATKSVRVVAAALAMRPSRASSRCAGFTCGRPSGWSPTKSRGDSPTHNLDGCSRRIAAGRSRRRRPHDRVRHRSPWIPRATRRRTGRSRAADGRVRRRVGDVWRRARVDESIPAQTGAMLGIPTANIAVHGYSTDQIYMRLARELPRFRQPAAVVSIFMTELFGRNLDDDRPHLGAGTRLASSAARLATGSRSQGCSCRIVASTPSNRASARRARRFARS